MGKDKWLSRSYVHRINAHETVTMETESENRLVDYPKLDLEIHNTQGGGLKDMSGLCLTTQRHGYGTERRGEDSGMRPRDRCKVLDG